MNKIKKFMSDDEMISIVAEDAPEIVASLARGLAPVWDGDTFPDWIERGVLLGHLKVSTIHKDGVPMYRYVWHLNDQNYLNVNGSLYVGPPGANDQWLWAIGADYIARQNKARGLIFVSRRLGHVEQCRRMGGKILGISMSKSFDSCPQIDA